MYYILGTIFGLLNFIEFGAFGLGEIFLILELFFFSYKKKREKKENVKYKIPVEILKIVLYIIFLSGYFLWSSVNNTYVLKAIFKWFTILIEVYYIYKSMKKNEIKTLELLISFLLFSKLADYHNFTSPYALHYFFLIPVFCLLYVKNNKNRDKFLLLIVCAIYLGVGKSRSALVLLIAFIGFEWGNKILSDLKSEDVNRKVISLLCVVAFLFCVFGAYNYVEKNVSSSTESNDERRVLIEIAIKEFKEKPFLGVGPINFNDYAQNKLGYRLRNTLLTPHNLYLEILSENGMMGFLLFFNIIMVVFKSFKNKNIKLSVHFCSIYIIVYYLFATFTGTNRIGFSILYAVVLYYYYNDEAKEIKYEKDIYNNTNI